jgi:hypothetical protein
MHIPVPLSHEAKIGEKRDVFRMLKNGRPRLFYWRWSVLTEGHGV